MPIDDALEQISTTEQTDDSTIKSKRKKKTSGNQIVVGITDQDVLDAMRKYVKQTIQYSENRGGINSTLITELVPYIRFDKEMNARFTRIPREELCHILISKSKQLEQLLNQTDASQAIPEMLNPENIEYNALLHTEEAEKVFKATEIQKFIEIAKRTFTIPDIGFIGLLIEQGKKALAYARIAGEYRREPLFYIKSDNWTRRSDNPTIVELKDLQKYYEQTRDKDISSMITQANEFQTILQSWTQKRITECPEIKEQLFKRLNQYHPELVYQEVKK